MYVAVSDILMHWQQAFVPGVTAEGIQKTNTYTLIMLLLDHLKYGVIYWML